MKNDLFNDLVMRGGLVQDKNELRLFENIEFSMYPARAFAVALNKLYNDKGIIYIKNLGKIMGDNSAKELKREISKIKSLIKKDYQTITNLIQISGFGVIDYFERKNNKFIIRIIDHPVIIPSKNLFGNKQFACTFYGEIYSSYIKTFNNIQKLNITHTKCMCKNHDYCEWIFLK